MTSKLDEMIGKYIDDARTKLGEDEPDVGLIRKVAEGLGPVIYKDDASKVSASDPKELERVKENFLMKKLGLSDDHDLDGAIDAVMEKYGRSNPNKHRVVVYYALTKHFGKESVYA